MMKLTKGEARFELRDIKQVLARAEAAIRRGDGVELHSQMMTATALTSALEERIERGEAKHWKLKCVVVKPGGQRCDQHATRPTLRCSEHAYRAAS